MIIASYYAYSRLERLRKTTEFLSRVSWCPEIRVRCLSNVGVLNLWHACTNWHAERFLGVLHSLLCHFPFLLLLPDQRLCIVKNVCVCVCMYTHICVETACELQLLPNNTASETFLRKSVAVRGVDRIFINGPPVWR